MGYSQKQRAEHHEKLLENASQHIREEGLASLNVVSLMKSVGLTHGGFYAHFDSKDQLVSQALKQALVNGSTNSQIHNSGKNANLESFVRGYLSKKHRDFPGFGCGMSALITEVSHQDATLKSIMEEHIDSFIHALKEKLGGDEMKAKMAVSTLIGALAISRVIENEEKSTLFMNDVREALKILEK